MKKLILSIFIVTGFAACKSDLKQDTSTRDIQFLTDTTAYQNNVFSDTAVTEKPETVRAKVSEEPRVIIIREKNIPARSTTKAPVYSEPAAVPPVATAPIDAPENTTAGTDKGTGDADSGAVSATPEVAKKKGWSKAAQGAAIGGVTGAVGGAILSKKKGLGAVVGGVVGAAGGYIIGKGMDKKDNRFIAE